MAVELDGNVRIRGDRGPGVPVRIVAENRRLRLVSGNELVGDWSIADIGISALQDGFNIKAEGEELVLRTEDDVALAEEIGVSAASPRLARRIAARHTPEEPAALVEPAEISSNLAAIGFAVAGALVILGGTILNRGGGETSPRLFAGDAGSSDFEFWIAFVVGGVLMVAAAYVMSIGTRVARVVAIVLIVVMIVVFGLAVRGARSDPGELTAYGFIAGGLVVGIAVLVSGSNRQPD